MGSCVPGHTLALLVDETPSQRERLAEYLTQHGISTMQAEDGLHGIAKAASVLPDVIAVDLGSPRRDFIDMCARLKKEPSTRHIPIVALTTKGTATELKAAKEAGCTSVLLKPCTPNELLTEIRRVLLLANPGG
jgi:CheY-like chemotaxis protein